MSSREINLVVALLAVVQSGFWIFVVQVEAELVAQSGQFSLRLARVVS